MASEGDLDGSLENLFKHRPLNYENVEQRFLILEPCAGDKNADENGVRCRMEIEPLADAKPFTAVKNSRGYRLVPVPIDIDGESLYIPVAIERFLRNLRQDDKPLRLWIRHICLIEEPGEESHKYWNRSFLDQMYERAEDVVDMAAFNTSLLESGKIIPVYDSRYMEWEKQWHGGPETAPLPKIFPIKVGQRPSITEPVDRFVYVPLDHVTDETRLIVLAGSEKWEDDIVMGLAHSPIKSAANYQAISYTWGGQQPTVDVVMNGQLFAITESLDRLLRDLRRKTGDVVLWIDAICIDQKNDPERNHQLRRMHRIYDTAHSVAALLGHWDENAGIALDFIPKLQSPMLRITASGKWNVGEVGEFSMEEFARHCAATYQFLSRPYFHRVWILQEIAWASGPFGRCGTHDGFSFWQLENAARNIQDMLERDLELAGRMQSAIPEVGTVSASELEFIRKMFYLRYLISKGAGVPSMLTPVDMPNTAPGFLETAIMARSFEASDPHDKIFALWNIAQDKNGLDFAMDYSDSLPDCYAKFTRAWTSQHKSLDIIAGAERESKSKEFYDAAPSWCSDWSVPSAASSMVRRETIPRRPMMAVDPLDGQLYSADGAEASSTSSFDFEGNKLHCTVYFVDQIYAMVPYADEEIRFAMYFGTMRKFYEDHEAPYDDVNQAFWAMCHGDVPSTWPARAEDDENYSPDKTYLPKRYKGDRQTARHIYRYVTDIYEAESFQVIKAVLRGRALGFTQQGYMCLLPHWAGELAETSAAPCRVAILRGCSTPVLLEELEDGNFRMAGSVFVQGWMEGEIINKMAKEQDMQSIWDSKESVSKICIV